MGIMNAHRIRLRGPWKIYVEKNGVQTEFQTSLPSDCHVIQQLISPFTGQLTGEILLCRRRFHSPTNLQKTDEIRLEVKSSCLPGELFLNDAKRLDFEENASCEITSGLQQVNEVQVAFSLPEFFKLSSHVSIWESVELEIRSDDD